jgi:ABC-type multidrug transport system fused ATPase/permease subunit
MDRKELDSVIEVLLDPDTTGIELEYSTPVDFVRKIVEQKKLNWTETQIRTAGLLLMEDKERVLAEVVKEFTKNEIIIKDVMHSSRISYWTTLLLHNITFYTGIAIIIASVYALLAGFDLFSLVFGSLGFSTIALLFLRQPITGVYRSIGNLIQLEIIYSNYVKQLGFWGSYVFASSDPKKIMVIKEIREITKKTICFIQNYCKREV